MSEKEGHTDLSRTEFVFVMLTDIFGEQKKVWKSLEEKISYSFLV